MSHARFELRAGTFKNRELEVLSFDGTEKLNTPFTYDVTFATVIDEGALQGEIFGFPACLTIYVPDHDARVIQGIAVSLESVGDARADNSIERKTFMLRIVPPLWLLNHRQAYRVFEKQGALDIAQAILKLATIDVTCFAKAGDHPAIPFVYQRNETDLQFLDRVLATAGIFYYFQHSSGLVSSLVPGGSDTEPACKAGPVTTLVFCDKADDTEALKDGSGGGGSGPPPDASSSDSGVGYTDGEDLPFDPEGHIRDHERITAFRARKEIRPGQAIVQDWNLPQDSAVLSNAKGDKPASTTGTAPDGSSVHKVSGYIVDSLATALGPDVLLVTEYQRDGAAIPGGSAGYYAKAALAQLRSDWVVCRGKSDSPRLAPGYRFVMTDHPVTSLNGEYLVTEITSRGRNLDHLPHGEADPFELEFVCVPSKIHPRPTKPAPMAPMGPEPAQVFGHSPGEMNTDSIGRIQVQFRWGKAGAKPTDPASGICWAQWLERWGGNGYGTVTVPRIGSEVWVEFPQQTGGTPVAVGQLYSSVNMPPWGLPGEASKTGIRTALLPGGAQFSEISIEDKGGAELVYIRAQKDHTTEVVNHEVKTALDYVLTTQKFIHEVAGTEISLSAQGGDITEVASANVKIGAQGGDLVGVASNNVKFQANSAEFDAQAATNVNITAGANYNATAQVNYTANAGVNHSVTAGAMSTTTAPITNVHGKALLAVDSMALITAGAPAITITAGKVMSLTGGTSGNVSAPTLVIEGDTSISISGGKVFIKSSGDMNIHSSGALNVKSDGAMSVQSGGDVSVKASGNVVVKGGNVKIN